MKFRSQYSAEILSLSAGCAAVGILLGVVLTSTFYLRKSADLAAELEAKSDRLLLLEQVLPQLVQLTRTGAVYAEFEAVNSAQTQLKEQLTHSGPAATADPDATRLSESPLPSVKAAAGAPPTSAQRPHQARAAAPAQTRVNPAPAAARTVTPSPSAPRSAQSMVAPGAMERNTESKRPGVPVATGDTDVAPVIAPPPPVTSEELAASVKNQLEGVPADKVGVARIDAGGVHLASGRYIRVGERFSTGERLLKVDPANDRVVTSERQLLLFFNR